MSEVACNKESANSTKTLRLTLKHIQILDLASQAERLYLSEFGAAALLFSSVSNSSISSRNAWGFSST